jgi:hypothetical protein
MNCICVTYVRSRCRNGQLVTVMAFVLGLSAGKDYSASRFVTTPVVPCVPEHHRRPDRIRPIRIWRVTSKASIIATDAGLSPPRLAGITVTAADARKKPIAAAAGANVVDIDKSARPKRARVIRDDD